MRRRWLTSGMPTRLQADADRRAATIRRLLADEFRRLREDAGLSCASVARAAGVHPSLVAKLEDVGYRPSLEAYVRISAALGADFAARPYPNTGPAIHDRHQVRMAELLIGSLNRRWRLSPEVAVRRPAGMGRCGARGRTGAHARRDRARIRPATSRADPPLESGEGELASICVRVAGLGTRRRADDLAAARRPPDTREPGRCRGRAAPAPGGVSGGSARRARGAHWARGVARRGDGLGTARRPRAAPPGGVTLAA